jgi:hypothetical protein
VQADRAASELREQRLRTDGEKIGRDLGKAQASSSRHMRDYNTTATGPSLVLICCRLRVGYVHTDGPRKLRRQGVSLA